MAPTVNHLPYDIDFYVLMLLLDFAANSTYDSLRSSTCTSCLVAQVSIRPSRETAITNLPA